MRSGDETMQAYAALLELLGGDSRKVGLILAVFHQSIGQDLRRMECAAVEGEWSLVRKLAQRMAIGCRQIGEESMAGLLVPAVEAAIERARYATASDPGTFSRLFEDARRELIDVLDRAAAHAATIALKSVA
jgi:hypothetical protein